VTYQITASPIRGQKETKTVEGVHELRIALSHYRERGYEIKRIGRPSRVLNFMRKLQVA